MMAHKAMKERHWQRIEDITKYKFDVESENFQLRNIMEAPLLENKEDIEVHSYTVIDSYVALYNNNLGCLYKCCEGAGY